MVFKKYIYKSGKRLGPYYYENIRTKNGKIKTVYVGRAPENDKDNLNIKSTIKEEKNETNIIKTKPGSSFKQNVIIALLLLLVISSFILVKNDFRQRITPLIYEQETKLSSSISTDQYLIKVLIKDDESLSRMLRITNIGNKMDTISIAVRGLEDLVNIPQNNFVLSPGQSKVVTININPINKIKSVVYNPGVYVGKIVIESGVNIYIPSIVEIESKE